MEDRIQRLEQLARLFESGALTDAEFAAEKTKVLKGAPAHVLPDDPILSDSPRDHQHYPIEPWDAAEEENEDDQYSYEPAHGPNVWRTRILFTFGMVALILVFHWTKQQLTEATTSGLSSSDTISPEIGSDDEEGVGEAEGSFGAARMSCRQAMTIAAVATCGMRMEEWQASNVLGQTSPQELRANLAGYRRSLQDARSVSGCSGSVSDGEAAAQGAFGDVDFAVVVDDIETAKRMCVSYAQDAMDSACDARQECR